MQIRACLLEWDSETTFDCSFSGLLLKSPLSLQVAMLSVSVILQQVWLIIRHVRISCQVGFMGRKRHCVNTRLSAGDLPVACRGPDFVNASFSLQIVTSVPFRHSTQRCPQLPLWGQWMLVAKTAHQCLEKTWKMKRGKARLVPGCLQELIFWAQFSFILTLFVNFGWFHVCWFYSGTLDPAYLVSFQWFWLAFWGAILWGIRVFQPRFLLSNDSARAKFILI